MKRKDLLFILISAFSLVVAWVVFNIYHNAQTSTITDATSIQIEPIDSTFDVKTIEAIKQRINISPIFVLELQPTIKVSSESGEKSSEAESGSARQATQSALQL